MKLRIGGLIASLISATVFATVPRISAQEALRERPRYVVRDLGTFGGPNSLFFF